MLSCPRLRICAMGPETRAVYASPFPDIHDSGLVRFLPPGYAFLISDFNRAGCLHINIDSLIRIMYL